jgi:hypothetical protein
MLDNDTSRRSSNKVGRAEAGEDTWRPHRSEFTFELKRGTTPEEEVATQEALARHARGNAGIQSEVLTFLGDRIGEIDSPARRRRSW